ncbi:deoxyribonuclease [Equid alphaherpesvirus 4]|uniref:Deoxyribonuclease n=1 Tax=Equid alphaherpesvirus 4 TaxID=10331 RepID=A0A120HUA2_9ALPH|nr:deoxyribonuclease [Equid alphaherpesvirus 4]AMB16174.1 deoxyribonuclease [Equid alphaherpesvirus 4]AMB16253.1 deoxyribonuclease [Equid alphaherpesvirus 4]BAV93415.1 deoxyribonuclease [Equid alphaherpesvirus 4]
MDSSPVTYSGAPPYKLRRLNTSYPYASKLRERDSLTVETFSGYINQESISEEEVYETMATTAVLSTRMYLPSVLPNGIATMTFLDHLKKSLPLPHSDKRLNPIFYRLAYIRDLVGQMEIEGIVERGTASRLLGARKPAGFVAGTYTHARDLSKTMSIANIRDAVLAIEAQTRDQSESQLWALLRRGLATASTMKWGALGPQYHPQWCELSTNSRGIPNNPALQFGQTNERTARSLISALYVARSEAATPDLLIDPGCGQCFMFDESASVPGDAYACGLLIDARTGVVGASLDMLVCDRDSNGVLSPHSTQTTLDFFEIKCRAKYLFDPDLFSPVATAYANLLKHRTAVCLRKFLRSIKNPAVEYFASNRVPGATEALITCNSSWKPREVNETNRRCGDFDKDHLALNLDASSDVWLFSEPDLELQTITPARWDTGELALSVPVFANPRHPNFKQILVQAYVLSGHFPNHKLRPFLVTFIGRHRKKCEEGKTFTICDRPEGSPYNLNEVVHSSCAIPILLIVTPVIVDREGCWEDIEIESLTAFNKTSDAIWDNDSRVDVLEPTSL